MKKTLIFENFVKYYFIFFIASYFLTYPIRVILKNYDISFTKYVIIFFMFILLSMQIIFIQYFSKRKFKKLTIIIILSLFLINVLYYINCNIIYSNEIILHHTFVKYIIYSILLISFLLFQNINFTIEKNDYSTKILLFILSFMTFLGTFLNSILWQIPYGVEIDEKYIVGIFLRAGAGYLDPNFLAMNIVILFFLNILLIDEHSILKKINLYLLIGSLFFTFSRGSWIFFSLIFFVYFYKEKKSVFTKRLVINVIVLLFIFLVLFLFFKDYSLDFDIIMRRFYDEEGVSSVNDRFYQYKSALNYFYENLSFSSLIVGFGGLDLFKSLYGVHLHNFFLGSILDVGFLGIFLIFFLLIYFYRNSHNIIAKYLLIYWVLQASTLPNLPDNMFVIFIISLVKIKRKE